MKIIKWIVFLSVLVGCEPKNSMKLPTYKASLYSDYNKKIDRRTVSLPKGILLTEDWKVIISDERIGLNIDPLPFLKFEVIELPHRVFKPNKSFWYQKKVSLTDGVLLMNADDGSQLWLNGQRVPHLFGEVFPYKSNGEEMEITVRVINNAMSGGLRSITWISKLDWETYSKELLTSEKEWILKRKSDLLVDKNLQNLEDYPAFLTDPIWLKSEEEKYHVKWISEEGGLVTINWGRDSLVLKNSISTRSSWGNFSFEVPEIDDEFFYQIAQEKTTSKIFSYQKEEFSDSLKFVVWGDSQGGWDVFKTLIPLMNKQNPKFSIGAGDLVGNGSDKEGFVHLLQSLSLAKFYHYLVVGNHDYDGYYEMLIPQNYNDMIGITNQKTYSSWREGNVAFISLDPNERFPIGIPENSEQYSWFLKQLESNQWKSAEWRFIVLHHPPYSQGWPNYHGEINIKDLMELHYESAKIDGLISAHSHNYERLLKKEGNQTVAFIVTGGGGGGLEPLENSDWPKMDKVVNEHHFGLFTINGKQLHFEAFNLENKLIDSFILTH